MIFAAGLGSRLQPLTLHTPKALVQVSGKPLLWHVLQRLKQQDFERIIINVHHFAEQIVDYLSVNKNFGLDISISDERDMLLETGGGIRKAMPLFDLSSPVLIHNVDILSNADLSSLWAQGDKSDAVLMVSQRQTKRYLLFDDDMCLQGWTNIETGEMRGPLTSHLSALSSYKRLAFSGIHVISPSLLSMMADWPERFGIIDFYLTICGNSRITAYQQPDFRLIDVGKLETLKQAEQFLNTDD